MGVRDVECQHVGLHLWVFWAVSKVCQRIGGEYEGMRVTFVKLTEQEAMRRITKVTQARIANRMGLSTTQVNGIYGGQKGITLAHLGAFLDAVGLRVVDANEDAVVVSRTEYAQIMRLASRSLSVQADALERPQFASVLDLTDLDLNVTGEPE